MRIIASLLFFSLAITSVPAQKVELDSAKNDRLNTLSQEIANLTRTPLGEGDLILKQWVQYTINKKGQNRSGIIHFSNFLFVDHNFFECYLIKEGLILVR